jgi:Carboxypeptidase regulatory-like domain
MQLRFAGVAILFLALVSSGFAQEVTATIVGTVSDTSGAVISNANVIVTNTDTNVVKNYKTDNQGRYVATLLPIGRYSVTVEAQGFQKFVQSGILLNVSDRVTVSPKMTVGSPGEQVNVEASAVQVDTQSAQAASLITGTQIRELSLNGRNWAQLMLLSPGVSDAGQSDQLYVGAFAPQGTNLVTFSVNGGRREHNNYMVDGADNVDRGSNLTLLSFPSVDSIAEFKIYRGQYDAELGRAGSGQINVITRSGTSKLHGNVFEFWRNDALNARPFASKYPVVTPHIPYLRYHNFGGTIGGPVYIPKIYEQTNKTFFFFSEEVRRNLSYTVASPTVPTEGMRNGQFSSPVCVAFNANNSCAATGTSIPQSSWDPVAVAYIQDIFSKYPLPNSGQFGFSDTLRNVFNFREEIYKIDHVVNEKLRFSGKILRDTIPTEESFGLFNLTPSAAVRDISTTSTNSPGHNYTVRATVALTPTLLIEPGYAYSYGAIFSDPIGTTATENSPNVAAAVHLPFTSALNRIPSVTMTGLSTVYGFGPYRNFNKNHTAFGNVTKVWGGHTFKFGGTYYHYQKSENAAGNNAGTLAYNANGVPAGTANAEQSWANFLLGRVGTFSQNSLDVTADIRDNTFEYYAQDSWRIRPNLTVTYGLRHSLFRQPTDALGLLGQFDPSTYDPAKAPCITATGAVDVTKSPAGVLSSACNPNYDPLNGYIFPNPPAGFESHKSPYGSKVGNEYNAGVAPRIGIAWDPWGDGKTSIRAGFGMFYDQGIIFGNAENNIFNGLGFNIPLSFTNVTTSDLTGGAPIPSTGIPASATRLQSRIPIDYKYPYTEQWSLDLQREVYAGWLLDVGYYGNRGVRLPGFLDLNQPGVNTWRSCTAASPCMSGTNAINFEIPNQVVNGVPGVTLFAVTTANTNKLNVLRPYLGYTGADAVRNIYDSNYHGLQTQLQKVFTNGTLINIAYTWSKNLTTYQADRSTGAVMPVQGDIRQNYGYGIGDRRHVFTANFVWQLPWQKKPGVAGHLLGGWQISGVQTFQTGLPATVSNNQLVDATGADCLGPSPCVFRAYQTGDPNLNQTENYERFFDPTVFVNPTFVFTSPTTATVAETTIPNERPGAVRLPGFKRTDLGIFKNFTITERVNAQFRFESFNTFNHLSVICCQSFAMNNANYNKVRSARDPRTLQLALKLSF